MSELEDVPPSEERKIPKFLLWTYLILLIGGLIGFFLYWNGSHGFLDRGYWQPLQKAAQTTFPFEKKEPYLNSPLKKSPLRESVLFPLLDLFLLTQPTLGWPSSEMPDKGKNLRFLPKGYAENQEDQNRIQVTYRLSCQGCFPQKLCSGCSPRPSF